MRGYELLKIVQYVNGMRAGNKLRFTVLGEGKDKIRFPMTGVDGRKLALELDKRGVQRLS